MVDNFTEYMASRKHSGEPFAKKFKIGVPCPFLRSLCGRRYAAIILVRSCPLHQLIIV